MAEQTSGMMNTTQQLKTGTTDTYNNLNGSQELCLVKKKVNLKNFVLFFI